MKLTVAGFVIVLSLFSAERCFSQSSAAFFDAAVVVGGDFSRFTNVLDFDGDGRKDVIGFWYFQSSNATVSIEGWRNDGTGKLTLSWSVQLSLGSYVISNCDLATGDLNGDGKDDFVVGVAGVLYYYLSNGVNSPTLWTTQVAGGIVAAVQMADFNGDGRADVVVANDSQTRLIITNPAGPPFTTSSFNYPLVGTPHLFLAEVNGDGQKDIGMAVSSTGTQLRLYPVVGGVMTSPLAFTLPFETMPMPTAGDIDHDGDEDVVVFGMTSYWVLRRTSPTTFSLESQVSGGPATALADVNGDGWLDGVCCGSGGSGNTPNIYTSHFEISINNGGVFAPAFSIASLGSLRIAGAVDLDGDGDVDLIGGRCVYYADGPITHPNYTSFSGIFQTERTTLDIDGDGDPDCNVGNNMLWFKNAGDGSFPIYYTPILPSLPAGTHFSGPGWPGDFDGDGDADLVVTQDTGTGAFIATKLLRNVGGAFVDGGDASGGDMRAIPPSTTPVFPMNPDNSLAADVDADGDLDLVVRVATISSVASKVWLNDGSGFFTPGQNLSGYAKFVGNLDSDVIPDLLTVFVTSSNVAGPMRLSRGLGGGTFASADAACITASTAASDQIVVADLDGNGSLDVIAPTGSSLFMGVNDGNGIFSTVFPGLQVQVEASLSSFRYVS